MMGLKITALVVLADACCSPHFRVLISIVVEQRHVMLQMPSLGAPARFREMTSAVFTTRNASDVRGIVGLVGRKNRYRQYLRRPVR